METDTSFSFPSQSPVAQKVPGVSFVHNRVSYLRGYPLFSAYALCTLRTTIQITSGACDHGRGSSCVGVADLSVAVGELLPPSKRALDPDFLQLPKDGKPLSFNELRLKAKVSAISFESSLIQAIQNQQDTSILSLEGVAAGLPGVSGQAGVSPSLSISNNCTEGNIDKTNVLQGGHKRCAEVIAQELLRLARVHGIEKIGFFTLTFENEPKTAKEALKLFHSLRTHVLKVRYVRGLRVLERGEKNDRLHFHCIIIMDQDIRTGFDFEDLNRFPDPRDLRRYRTANSFLSKEWAFWRETAPKYGFGRTELLPVISTAEGIARYVGSYIGKHIRGRHAEDKGSRLVGYWGYGAGDRAATCQFSFRTENSAIWRFKVAKFAKDVGAKTTDDLKALFGPKWCFLFYDEIMLQSLHGWDDGIGLAVVSDKAIEQDRAIKEEISQRLQKASEDRQWLQYDKWEKIKAHALIPVKIEARKLCSEVADELFFAKD